MCVKSPQALAVNYVLAIFPNAVNSGETAENSHHQINEQTVTIIYILTYRPAAFG